ncbi:lysozyme-like [Macrosteles quadrilineatus]|uniref:lysozyme-like n=1 Tax=Macrosteles quadrilineatus TaxID=74068 RepID=UPI0023E339B6|nr:lysozyme-like [Macrosteles quadrilineatus]XP_054269742.1 lysozyme-like [Macrosteles quadrilineatus]
MALWKVTSALLVVALGIFTVQGQLKVEPVTEICLGCICEAVSNCNRSLQCTGDVCGIFRITWAYWADAGKPLLTPQEDVNAADAYTRCVNDPPCAGKTVTGYMNKFAQDCNGDGVVNCYDYAAIHRQGGYGCRSPLDAQYQDKFQNCLKQVEPYLNQG